MVSLLIKIFYSVGKQRMLLYCIITNTELRIPGYWGAIVMDTYIRENSLLDFLEVVHKDIVLIWNNHSEITEVVS
jgi:hypothetical protein